LLTIAPKINAKNTRNPHLTVLLNGGCKISCGYEGIGSGRQGLGGWIDWETGGMSESWHVPQLQQEEKNGKHLELEHQTACSTMTPAALKTQNTQHCSQYPRNFLPKQARERSEQRAARDGGR